MSNKINIKQHELINDQNYVEEKENEMIWNKMKNMIHRQQLQITENKKQEQNGLVHLNLKHQQQIIHGQQI